MNVPHAQGSPMMHPDREPGSPAAKEMVVNVGALHGPTSRCLSWQKPMVTMWGLSMPKHLIHQVGCGCRSITETNELGTAGPGSTEFDLVHTGDAPQR